MRAGTLFQLGDRKGSLFRIHRDVRFAKDKSPYKTNVGAVMTRMGGAKFEPGLFYVHVSPGDCMTAAGFYDPAPETLAKLRELEGPAAASAEDLWQRRTELLFERLAVSWEIAGLPLTSQKELLGRYRMASPAERSFVRDSLRQHVHEHFPELQAP